MFVKIGVAALWDILAALKGSYVLYVDITVDIYVHNLTVVKCVLRRLVHCCSTNTASTETPVTYLLYTSTFATADLGALTQLVPPPRPTPAFHLSS